jgi:cytochrome P450
VGLHYLEAVISETMRIVSHVPLSLPHKSTRDTTLAGYDIPKGTLLISNLWAMHHNPKDWHNPEQFLPERFIDGKNNLRKNGVRNFMPFGAGRRHCIGKSLAKSEVFLVSARLLHQFVFKNPPGMPLPTTDGCPGVVMHPKPFKMIVEERA